MGKKISRLWALAKTGSDKEKAKALFKLANHYFEQKEYVSAASSAATSADLFSKLGKTFKEIYSRRMLGIALTNLERNDEAIDEFSIALKLAQSSLDETAIADVSWSMGFAFDDQAGVGGQIECWSRCFEIYERLGYQDLAASSARRLAGIYSEVPDEALTIKYFNESIRLREAAGNLSLVGLNRHDFGVALYKLGNFYESFEQLKQGLVIFQFLENADYEAKSWYEMGQAEISLGQIADAQVSFQEAVLFKGNLYQQKISAISDFQNQRLEYESTRSESSLKEINLLIPVLRGVGAAAEADEAQALWNLIQAGIRDE